MDGPEKEPKSPLSQTGELSKVKHGRGFVWSDSRKVWTQLIIPCVAVGAGLTAVADVGAGTDAGPPQATAVSARTPTETLAKATSTEILNTTALRPARNISGNGILTRPSIPSRPIRPAGLVDCSHIFSVMSILCRQSQALFGGMGLSRNSP